jgi:hypothetical protein
MVLAVTMDTDENGLAKDADGQHWLARPDPTQQGSGRAGGRGGHPARLPAASPEGLVRASPAFAV